MVTENLTIFKMYQFVVLPKVKKNKYINISLYNISLDTKEQSEYIQ